MDDDSIESLERLLSLALFDNQLHIVIVDSETMKDVSIYNVSDSLKEENLGKFLDMKVPIIQTALDQNGDKGIIIRCTNNPTPIFEKIYKNQFWPSEK